MGKTEKIMGVSIDGLRKNASRSMEELYSIINEIVADEDINEQQIEELKEKFNEASRYVSTFNCIYHPDIKDFNDLSALDISRFE